LALRKQRRQRWCALDFCLNQLLIKLTVVVVDEKTS
jgi:hypothetical protein